MIKIKASLKRHLLPTYFALTFAISWGSILVLIGTGGILGTKEISEGLLPFVYLATLLGPSVAGILLTGLVYGRAGFRELLSRLLRWRVGFRWYVIALLTFPLVMTAILFPLSLTSPVFLPGIFATDDKAFLLISGIVGGLLVGIFEELGWTVLAVPQMRLRFGVMTTGLIMGFLWGLWHFPLFTGSSSSSGTLPRALYLSVVLFSFLPPFRMLMVWVYDRTRSLLVIMLMHMSLTASVLILQPMTTGVHVVIYDLILAAALWVFVAVVAVTNGAQLERGKVSQTR